MADPGREPATTPEPIGGTDRGSVVVTGGAGYLGAQVVRRLVADGVEVTAVDRRRAGIDGADQVVLDVRDPALADLVADRGAAAVVHLAAIVDPPPGLSAAEVRDIDVGGTRNVLAACLVAGVSHLTVASSGAAYGYHPTNAGAWLTEDARLRGHDRFAYSANKRDVEALLADARRDHPSLGQLILRPGTILGATTRNQITALFDARVVLDLAGTDVPFVFVLDTDVVDTIVRGVAARRAGVFNLAGDGVVTLADIARAQRKRRLPLPVGLLRGALRVLSPLHVVRYGPEQVDFLRYRPVLANDAWRAAFPGLPSASSREVFDAWLAARRQERA